MQHPTSLLNHDQIARQSLASTVSARSVAQHETGITVAMQILLPQCCLPPVQTCPIFSCACVPSPALTAIQPKWKKLTHHEKSPCRKRGKAKGDGEKSDPKRKKVTKWLPKSDRNRKKWPTVAYPLLHTPFVAHHEKDQQHVRFRASVAAETMEVGEWAVLLGTEPPREFQGMPSEGMAK